jgi:hypothetical protein
MSLIITNRINYKIVIKRQQVFFLGQKRDFNYSGIPHCEDIYLDGKICKQEAKTI